MPRASTQEYRGWLITFYTFHGRPIWTASQNGVSMNTNTEKGVKEMVDAKIYSWLHREDRNND